MSKTEETITIPLSEYNKLIDSDAKLDFLHNHGVDNWDWYGDAMEDFENWKNCEEDDN